MSSILQRRNVMKSMMKKFMLLMMLLVLTVSVCACGGNDDVEEQVRPNDGVIYDLHGCVVKNPGKGIYIVNGKKVLF